MSLNRSLLTQITEDLKNKKKPSKPRVPRNQWQHPGEVTNIPSNNITMDGVSYPVLGVPNVGPAQMMYPDQQYNFPGAGNVTEYPMMQEGGDEAMRAAVMRGADTALAYGLKGAKWIGKNVFGSDDIVPDAAKDFFFNRIRPISYPTDLRQVYSEIFRTKPAKPTKDLQGDLSMDEEAWSRVLNRPTKSKYFIPSQYRPTSATDPSAQYYQMAPGVINEDLMKRVLTEHYFRQNGRKNSKGQTYVPMQTLEPFMSKEFMKNYKKYAQEEFEQTDPLANFQVYEGKDPKTGKRYLSISDVYDFGLQSANELIKPMNIYHRVYKQGGVQTRDEREMVNGIADILTQVNDKTNREQIARQMMADFERENVTYNPEKFIEMSKLKNGGQHGGLDRWFAEKWVDIKTGKPCGRQEGESRGGYPACRPSKRINSDTPKTAGELSGAEKAKFKREKTSSDRIDYQHRRREEGGEELYNTMEEFKSGGNTPTNPSLWSRAKSLARQKYDVYPSAYANGWAAKWYKSHGGGWRKAEFGGMFDEGGTPDNPGFKALPPYVQAKIMSEMAAGGEPQNAGFQALPEVVQQQIIDNMAFGGMIEDTDYSYMANGGIPERYRNMGFTSVGTKKNSTRPGKKWMVLAKKGDDYKVVHGGYDGMKDYTQHGSEERRKRFWDRMGGKNSAKASDPFSPLYWHKRFGTWKEGGSTHSGNAWYQVGGTPFRPDFTAADLEAQANFDLDQSVQRDNTQAAATAIASGLQQSVNAANPFIQIKKKKSFNSMVGDIQDKFMEQYTNPYSLTNVAGYAGNLIDGINNRNTYNDELDRKRQNYSTDYAYQPTGNNTMSRGQYDMSGQMVPNKIGGNLSFTGMNQKYSSGVKRFQAGGISDFDYIADRVTPVFNNNPGSFENYNTVAPADATRVAQPVAAVPAGPISSDRDDIRNIIGTKESQNNYGALPKLVNGRLPSSAVGKYQFLWDSHKAKIKEITGIGSKEAFRSNPQAQEKFFDYWNNSILTPVANEIMSRFKPKMSMNDIKQIIHFQGPGGAKEFFRTGKYTADAYGSSPMSYLKKKYAVGGEMEVTEDELAEILRNGGQVEYM